MTARGRLASYARVWFVDDTGAGPMNQFARVKQIVILLCAGFLIVGFVRYAGFFSSDPDRPFLFGGSKASPIFRSVSMPNRAEEVLPPPEVETEQDLSK